MIFPTGKNIYWRISDENGQGSDVVSIVLANHNDIEVDDVEIETDIISSPFQTITPQTPIVIEWDKKDLELFLTLVKNTFNSEADTHGPIHIELDFTDESVVTIMHIVAAAHFSTPYTATDILNVQRTLATPKKECNVGDLVSIDTIDGYKSTVIVKSDEKVFTCVLLDEITCPNGDNIRLDRHDLIIVKREWVLPAAFADVYPAESDSIH